MAEKTGKAILQELHQAVIGIPENPEDNGLIGDVKEVKETLKLQNSRIQKNERALSRLKGIFVGLGILGGSGGIAAGILAFFS